MFAKAQKEIRDLVIGGEIIVVNVTGEDNIFECQVVDHPDQRFVIHFKASPLPNQQQAAIRIDKPLVEGEDFDEVVKTLIGNDPADEEKIGLVVVEHLGDHRTLRNVQTMRIQDQRQHSPSGESP